MVNKTVMVAVLCGSERDGWIVPQLMLRILEGYEDLRRPIDIQLIVGFSPVDRARNEAVARFLKSQAEWLVQIDNDVVPSPHFLRMIPEAEQSGRFVLGCPTPFVGETICFNTPISTRNGNLYGMPSMLRRGWFKSPTLGGAVLMVHRKVFEKLAPPYFQIDPEWLKTNGRASREDFFFGEKATAAGFECWAHVDFPASHLHTCDLLQLISLFNRERHGDKILGGTHERDGKESNL